MYVSGLREKMCASYTINGHWVRSLWIPGIPCWLNSKESACQADKGSIPGLGRSPGKGKGSSFQYSCLGNPIDRGASWTTVPRVTESQTQLSTHMYIQSRTLAILDYSLIHSSVNSSCITNYLGNVYLLKQSHSKQPGVGTSTRKWGWESTIQSITRCKSTAM